MAETPPCRACGKSEWVCAYWPEHPERAICIECCGTAEHHDGETGHVWTHDPAERDYVCDHCGQFARCTDYYDNQEPLPGDISLSELNASVGTRGTPISQLRGRPDGTLEGQAGYERFKAIAASWGYD